MAIVDYDAERGWFDPRVVPYGPLSLDPAAAVLPLRAGDVRRAEGLPRRRRQGPLLPRRPPLPAHARRRRAALHPAGRPGADARGDPGARARRRRLGAVVARHVALHPADDHRHRAVPGRAPGQALPLLRDRVAGRRLHAARRSRPARILVEDKYVRAAVGRPRRREGGRELHRQPARRRGRQGARLRAGALDRRGRAHATSKRSAP